MAAGDDGVARLVVGVDGSEHAAAALKWAVRMARGMGSSVTAVFVMSPPVTFDTGFAPAIAQNDPEWRAAMKKKFEDEWCKPLREAGVNYRARMEVGRPASVIAQVADEVNADVILVGRRGLGGVSELLLGSVSHELVLHCKRPVLVISA